VLSAAENIRLTSSGPGTAGGALLRQYWQPVALSEELDPTRPLKCVALLGEPLVLFRDEHGELGLIERHCPHRGADLSYGRLEDGGLRCVFHGWLFDAHGNCLQQPAEPLDSRMHEHIQQRAYPCLESNGVIFAYLGEGSPPKLPALDCLHAPHSHVFAFKGMMECNWMQALEVGIDPAHASYLHRFLADDDPDDAYGKQFRAKTALTDMPLTQLLREYPRPRLNGEDNFQTTFHVLDATTTTVLTRNNSVRRPIPAWVKISMCTTSGRLSLWAHCKTARVSIWAIRTLR
jgi:phthalate 4,5-dioxygenase oxygenase subunit